MVRKNAFYKNVLALEPPDNIKLICDGIKTILDHVPSLLSDAGLLFDHERYAIARFVVATADEELGKLHILIDAAARLETKVSLLLIRICTIVWRGEVQNGSYRTRPRCDQDPKPWTR